MPLLVAVVAGEVTMVFLLTFATLLDRGGPSRIERSGPRRPGTTSFLIDYRCNDVIVIEGGGVAAGEDGGGQHVIVRLRPRRGP